MNFVELIAVAGTMASILGVFLAVHARYNNRLVKEESRHTREILTRIERGQEEARKEMAEAIRYLGDLIRAEGDRTSQAIAGMSG